MATEAVDDDLDVVPGAAGKLDLLGEIMNLPVDSGAHEAVAPELIELLLVLPLSAAHDRREDLDLRALLEGHDPVDHLLEALARDGGVALPAVGGPGAGVEQAEVVRDFSDRADGRARAAADALLLDGDCGRQAFDLVDVGARELVEELSCVGREALDVASLAFGVERVEGGLDLPDPDGPVTTTKRPRGIRRSTFWRLWVRAPRMSISWGSPFSASAAIVSKSRARRSGPVVQPAATTPSGVASRTRSAESLGIAARTSFDRQPPNAPLRSMNVWLRRTSSHSMYSSSVFLPTRNCCS